VEINKTLFWIGHASFYIKAQGKTIFIDPFNITPAIKEKADLVLITHAHSDHCSKDQIERVLKPEGEVICPQGCLDNDIFKNFTLSKPGFKTDFNGISIDAVPAYNVKKERAHFHPKKNNWVGYVIDIEGFKIYHAGDTDFIDEMRPLRGLGASLLPMGGTYVMDANEAASAANAIGAQYAVPMHYKALLGREGSANAEKIFREKVRNALFMKEVQEPFYSF
jgi:L-ascorbate metabolism protein UlaG (beta-lactamase superfamily)